MSRSDLVRGSTRLAAVIGHPVAHSLSPALHNAGFADSGADWVYVAFDVPEGAAAAALASMRALGIGGLSVTMPHKEAVAELVDVLDPAAAALRSVNTVVALADGRLQGHSTDGAGFVASMHEAGVDLDGRSVAVLGAGAAARAIIDALGRVPVGEIVIVNRSADRAETAATLGNGRARIGAAGDVRDVDVVVNATSVGMGPNSRELPVHPGVLRAGQVVADIVYHPRRTAFLDMAEQAGARTVDGLGMLVHQAVLQQVLFTGLIPSVAVMRAAAERELAARGQ